MCNEFDGLVEGWDNLKDDIPSDGHKAAESLWDYGDKLADAIQTLQTRLAESEARGAAVRKVRDGYASQAKFADHEQAAHFREFVRRLDAVFLANPERTHG